MDELYVKFSGENLCYDHAYTDKGILFRNLFVQCDESELLRENPAKTYFVVEQHMLCYDWGFVPHELKRYKAAEKLKKKIIAKWSHCNNFYYLPCDFFKGYVHV
jgi:hypothetical protein